MRAIFHKEEDRLRSLVNELYYKKVIKLIMEKVKIRDVDTPLSGTAGDGQSDAKGE